MAHGETIAEPVAPGTNRAALESDIDILAHPGLISEQEVIVAGEKGILLEISARKGHSLTNGHVARLAKNVGAKLVINTDAHDIQGLHQMRYGVATAQRGWVTKTDVLNAQPVSMIKKWVKRKRSEISFNHQGAKTSRKVKS